MAKYFLFFAFSFAAFTLVSEQPAEANTCPNCPNGFSPNNSGSCVGQNNAMMACPSGNNSTPFYFYEYLKVTSAPTLQGGTNSPADYDVDQYIKDHPEQFKDDSDTGLPGHLGMYVSGSQSGTPSVYSLGGGAVTHDSGTSVTDTAGAIGPGTLSPISRTTSGNAEIGGAFDASRFFGLAGNQTLIVRGLFDYVGSNTSFGLSPGLAAVGAGNLGSINLNTYTFSGSFDFDAGGAYYVKGITGFNVGSGTTTNNGTGGRGNSDSNGYYADITVGKVFTLLNTIGSSSSTPMLAKAARKPSDGYILALDLSGSLGYWSDTYNGFTDSSGFTFGDEKAHAGDLGGRAKLFMLYPSAGVVWVPYVAGTVDQFLGYSHTLNIPAQAAAVADTLNFNDAKTFWGGELGLETRGPHGWIVGAKGFYTASADANIAGGNAYIKIPFNYMPIVSARY
jgi:hypothetical protein